MSKQIILSSLRKVIRETVERLLRESVCPGCGDRGAYVGMNDVDCPNSKCKHHKKNATKKQEDWESWPEYLEKIKLIEKFGALKAWIEHLGIDELKARELIAFSRVYVSGGKLYVSDVHESSMFDGQKWIDVS